MKCQNDILYQKGDSFLSSRLNKHESTFSKFQYKNTVLQAEWFKMITNIAVNLKTSKTDLENLFFSPFLIQFSVILFSELFEVVFRYLYIFEAKSTDLVLLILASLR